MITFGYAKGYKYTGDGRLLVKVRVPSVHGPYSLKDYKGATVRNYVEDDDLPWYDSILLPHFPVDGEVVAVSTMRGSTSSFIVIGLTGGSYKSGVTNLGG